MKQLITFLLSGVFIRKILLLAIVVLAVVGNTRAQEETSQQVRWGIKGGLNIATLRFSNSGDSDSADPVIGAVAGVTLDYSFAPKWWFHTGLELSMKGFALDMGDGDKFTAHANYLQLPLEVGYEINIGKTWHFEPRLGFYLAYGIAGKTSVTGISEKASTFGDDLYKKPDFGLGVGFYFDNSKIIFGMHVEAGFLNIDGDNFELNDINARNNTIAFTIGYLF